MVSAEPDIKELLAKIECPELAKLQKLYPGLDFEKDLTEKPRLVEFMKQPIQDKAMDASDPLLLPNAPKLNDDFSNYFVINNLPTIKKEEEAKVDKLKALIQKVLKQHELNDVDNDDIEIPFNEENTLTFGTAFLKMKNEEQARLGARIFQGQKLGKKVFATCLFHEFD